MKGFFAACGLILVMVAFLAVGVSGGNIVNSINYYIFGTVNEKKSLPTV